MIFVLVVLEIYAHRHILDEFQISQLTVLNNVLVVHDYLA